jgi:hypothetical protein
MGVYTDLKGGEICGKSGRTSFSPSGSSLLFIAFSIVETCTSIKVINGVRSYNRIMVLVGT